MQINKTVRLSKLEVFEVFKEKYPILFKEMFNKDYIFEDIFARLADKLKL
jgi:hypothetical protein